VTLTDRRRRMTEYPKDIPPVVDPPWLEGPMPSTSGHPALRLAILILLAVVVGGCGGDADSPTAAPATTAAPTTTTRPPLNAEELGWLKGLSGVRTKVEKSFKAMGSGPVTRANR
jgi:hypothetical protein